MPWTVFSGERRHSDYFLPPYPAETYPTPIYSVNYLHDQERSGVLWHNFLYDTQRLHVRVRVALDSDGRNGIHQW